VAPNKAIRTAFWRQKSIFFLKKAGDVVASTAQLRLIYSQDHRNWLISKKQERKQVD
jgi:hypothetical protein